MNCIPAGRCANTGLVLCTLLTLVVSCPSAQTMWKPERNVEIMVPSAPGGGFDRTGRTMQRVMQQYKLLDVSSSIVNKAGGGGAVGWAYLSQFAGDAHHIGICSSTLLTNQITGGNPLTYKDFTLIANLFNEYFAFAVRPDSPIKTGKDLLDRLTTAPGSLAIGTANAPGGPDHIGVALVVKGARADFRRQKIVFFKNGSDVLTAILGGHVDVMASSPGNLVPALEAKQVRVIAVAAPHRQSGAFATVPTWKEFGVEGIFSNWRCILGPRGLSAAKTAYWEDALARVVASDDWKAEVEHNVWESNFLKSEATRKFFESQYAVAQRVLSELGLIK